MLITIETRRLNVTNDITFENHIQPSYVPIEHIVCVKS